jgi:Holliday junction resolvase RusA-like endonuclease
MKIKYKGKLVGYNQRYCNRRFVLSAVYRNFKKTIRMEFITQNLTAMPLRGDVIVTIKYNSLHDADNIAKAINDSLEGLAFYNDNQIKELHVYKTKDIEKGFICSVDLLGA